jgi:AbrB family looped-hinge helix DNA binding protein
MDATIFTDNAKVMPKGQITIPKAIRTILGVDSGDRITFIVDNGEVKVENSAVYAMKMLQSEMAGEAERTGITSEQDVLDLVKSVRDED